MAASTPNNFTLQARDWEALIGIVSQTSDPEILNIVFNLQTQYNALVTKPITTTPITVATTEDVIVKFQTYLFGNTILNIATDTGASAFTRIMAAVRAANNAADNYIATSLAANDATYAASAANIRKNGRKTVMMLTYDNT